MFRDINKLFDESLNDLSFRQDQLRKGENLLKVQLTSLYYALDFGVDLAFFLESAIQFQNATLQAYLTERLASNYLVVSEFDEAVKDFFAAYNIKIAPMESGQNAIQQ